MPLLDQLETLRPGELRGFVGDLEPSEIQGFLTTLYDWEAAFARPEQCEPKGQWRTWLIKAGRGFGKTRSGAEWVRKIAQSGRARRIALVGRVTKDVRDVMIEGVSGILAVSPPWYRPRYEPSLRRLTWPRPTAGVSMKGQISVGRPAPMARGFTAEEPEELRGPEHDHAWCCATGTPVEMADGSSKPIEWIREGDKVATPAGPRRVRAASRTGAQVPVVELETASGARLVCTPNHRIWSGGAWTEARDLMPGSDLLRSSRIGGCRQRKSSGMGVPGGSTGKTTSAILRGAFYTVAKWRRIWAGSSPLKRWFTTATATSSTTGWPISSSYLASSITPDIPTWDGPLGLSISDKRLAERPGSAGNRRLEIVGSANNRTRPEAPTRSTARRNVGHEVATTASDSLASSASAGRSDVYDLQIDGAHCFFAAGLLVHNCDELASWKTKEAWDNLMLSLRLGIDPRVCVTTTPKPTALLKKLIARKTTVVTGGSTYENLANLAQPFIDEIITEFEGTAKGEQELYAKLLEEAQGALWHRKWIEKHRVRDHPDLDLLLVAIDPAASTGEHSSETGIVAAGRAWLPNAAGKSVSHYYVLDDVSGKYTPGEWGQTAIDCRIEWDGDYLVGEKNNGGDMVKHTLNTIDPNEMVKEVWASRGKAPRAAPVAQLYEQGRVHHVGMFTELEDQQCQWEPDTRQASPDRLDALVWAISQMHPTGKARKLPKRLNLGGMDRESYWRG